VSVSQDSLSDDGGVLTNAISDSLPFRLRNLKGLPKHVSVVRLKSRDLAVPLMHVPLESLLLRSGGNIFWLFRSPARGCKTKEFGR
jgi:hypothetical protein